VVYVPTDHLLWDFWLAPRRPGESYHLFHLQAPRDLPDPELRHGMATIGHAVSDDLVAWTPRPTAFVPGSPGSWDDRAIWTGSIVRHDGVAHFFYTAIQRGGFVQRIGLATSTDPALERWERHPANPILTADRRWYAPAAPRRRDGALSEDCRDPWVIRAPNEDAWYLFFTAGASSVPADERGVVGCARSTDLVRWEPLPPVVGPGEFGELEVPQVVELGGRWYLFFCTRKHSARRRARLGDQPAARWYGTHYLVADRPTGPYRLLTDEALVGDDAGTYYAGRIATDPNGRPVFLAWRQFDEGGAFLGGLSNPSPLAVLADGRLRVDTSALWPEAPR
jgi:beta-fructofuranosidase